MGEEAISTRSQHFLLLESPHGPDLRGEAGDLNKKGLLARLMVSECEFGGTFASHCASHGMVKRIRKSGGPRNSLCLGRGIWRQGKAKPLTACVISLCQLVNLLLHLSKTSLIVNSAGLPDTNRQHHHEIKLLHRPDEFICCLPLIGKARRLTTPSLLFQSSPVGLVRRDSFLRR